MIYTTLNRIREHSPCAAGWKKLLAHLGKTAADDEPLALSTVLDSNGTNDALWCLRAEPQHSSIWRLFAVRCARRVQHLMTDPRSVAALDVAERHARGGAADDELAAARDAAWDAALDAAWAAAWAAALDAAWDAALDAAWAAAWAAAMREIGDDLRGVLNHYDAEPGGPITGWRDVGAARAAKEQSK
ncbi:MAG: hypothetical protein HY856_13335 [Burkholderiales bacterium]|nr:hypothetical protein [Burkholderiales bacterium]